jgi:hypothetical protein
MGQSRWNYLTTGTVVMTGIVKGTVTGGPKLTMSMVKPDTLSALVTVKADTDTITLSVLWEGSSDGNTYYEITPTNNAALVVWGTGTAGADAAVTKLLQAPEAAYGVPYARCSVKNLVADGLIADTYAIGYCFEQKDQY